MHPTMLCERTPHYTEECDITSTLVINITNKSKVGTSPVLFSSPVSMSIIDRVRDTLDGLI